MLKLTQEEFDSTIDRTIEELDIDRAAEWKALGAGSERVRRFLKNVRRYFAFGNADDSLLRALLLSGVQFGYELAKTESANERAELAERSNQLA